MANLLKKITDLPALSVTPATGDKLIIFDADEATQSQKTKAVAANLLHIYTDAQLANDCVTANKVADNAIGASNIQSSVIDYTKMARMCGALVLRTAALTVPNDTPTTMVWNLASYNSGTCWDTASSTSRLYAKVSGIYVITANIAFAADTDGWRFLAIDVNGTEMAANLIDAPIVYCAMSASITVALTAGSYASVRIQQYSGGNLALYPLGSNNNFSMQQIGA